jgi:hypothetical protein
MNSTLSPVNAGSSSSSSSSSAKLAAAAAALGRLAFEVFEEEEAPTCLPSSTTNDDKIVLPEDVGAQIKTDF